MKRRQFIAAAAAFVLLSAGSARADDASDYVEDIVDWLQESGFTDISVVQSLLGRMVITARLGERIREIACNPRTGEILRDVWLNDPSGPPPQPLPDDLFEDGGDNDDEAGESGKSGSGSGNSGRGGGSGHGGKDD